MGQTRKTGATPCRIEALSLRSVAIPRGARGKLGQSMNDARALSHGAKSSNKGDRGITKRLEALAGLTPLKGERLLDIGCADGTYTMRLAGEFTQVDAIDIEQERLKDFCAKIPDYDPATYGQEHIRVFEMSADSMLLADDTYDMVTAIEVLEHVGDLNGTLGEVHRVLKPGGRFCVTTPNRWFPFETHGPLIGGKRRPAWVAPGLPWIAPLHRRMSDARAFTRKGLAAQAADHGLRLVGGTWIMPPFDRSPVGRRIRPITDWIERGPLGFLGMALVLVFEKAPQ